MNASRIGALVGLLLGVIAVCVGVWQAIVVLVLGLLGLIIGRIIDGQLDVHDIFGDPVRSSSRHYNDVSVHMSLDTVITHWSPLR